ncbi:purine-nucleoside phosphorylase [Putridiphycobacter roseus]|uniref:Purine nucleoside phosphorylase n=1 Tax=Putridiphycobacter roseus TaxID=2219161 RepID=A0A2W1N1G3_9FLAO|nr:purine-nucleoside phosphorylase [Putridiphycobacter roseus]PZE17634.1 purine-nucleoside phosphorylase [Putridiphycobacter roseus]
MFKKIAETTDYIHDKAPFKPEFGIILGTGLGGLVSEIDIKYEINYADIPHFPVSTVESHSGRLIFGELNGKNVMVMQGRFHFYEGYSMEQITFPVRIMKMLGVHKLFVSNASGGLNPDYEVGEIMIINDHINLFPSNPLIGKNIDELGPRFPDMSDVYDKTLISKAKSIANKHDIKVSEGVYVGLTGPCLETPAEYKYLRIIGGDTVGMSTIPEVIVARHMDIPVFAISIITDLGVPGKIKKVNVQEIIAVAAKQEPKMTIIMKDLIASA